MISTDKYVFRCEKCKKTLLTNRKCSLFLKTRGIIFPKCPGMDLVGFVICPHCKAENIAPINFTIS